MAAYWLPCPKCGERLRVETSQAGESLACRCGAAVEAPTLREMSRLEVVDEAAEATGRWGAKQGLGLVAFAAAVATLLGAGYLEWSVFSRVVRPDPEVARTAEQEFDAMTPADGWYVWQTLKLGLFDPEEHDLIARQRRARFWQQALLASAGVLAVVGVLLALPRRSALAAASAPKPAGAK